MPSGVGQGNDGMQLTTQWRYDDGQGNYGTQSIYQQPRDYGQGNDGIQSTNQWHYDDGQGNYGMQWSSQWFGDPSFNM